MGGGGSSGGTQTTKTTAELPAYAQPQAEALLSRGEALSNQPYQTYTGQRSADFTPEQNLALGLTTQRALAGNPSMAAGNTNLADTLNGNYLDVTKAPGFQQGLDDITKAYQTGTAAQTDGAANRAGVYGGSVYNEMTGMNARNFGDSLNKYVGDQYQAERLNQQRALALAPQYAANDYTDLNALGSVGDIRQSYNQSNLDQQYSDWFNQQQTPYRNLDVLSSALAGSVGNSGTTTSTSTGSAAKGSKVGGALGGAASGASMGSMFGPWGAAIGGVGGGLLGLFGK